MSIRGKVAIVGAVMIPFVEWHEKSLETMAQEAYIDCLNSVDKGMDPKDIKAAWLGNAAMAQLGAIAFSGSWLSSQIGNAEIPISRVENGCPTGSDAVRHGVIGVASGLYDVVLVLGAEKMREKPGSESLIAIGSSGFGGSPAWTWGSTAPAMQALYAARQMHELGCTQEQFARVAVKNHKNGSLDPLAHYRFEVTIDQVLNSPMVCWPLHLLDCCPQTDGAAALILCRSEIAHRYTDKPVYVLGTNVGMDHSFYWDKHNFIEMLATVRAAKGAFEMAGIGPSDVDFAEVHDCFSNTELLNIEDIGFCKKGEAGKLMMEGHFDLNGELPVQTAGGLKAHGHPIGATGVSQVCECYWQLREEASERQVTLKNGIGLQHNVGGTGFGVSCINIMSRTP